MDIRPGSHGILLRLLCAIALAALLVAALAASRPAPFPDTGPEAAPAWKDEAPEPPWSRVYYDVLNPNPKAASDGEGEPQEDPRERGDEVIYLVFPRVGSRGFGA